jgi:N-acetylmuramoyl-L-alanine amidase
MLIKDLPSPNYNLRSAPPDMVVLHYTGMVDGPSAIARLRDPEAKVSAHYVIEEDGKVFRLVPDDKRAYHAGVSHWLGVTDINDRAIGFEIVNGGHDFGLPSFPEAQIAVVIELLKGVLGRCGIAPERVVGHSDVAPQRKQDPGERFPWARLAEAGVAEAAPKVKKDRRVVIAEGGFGGEVEALRRALGTIGYNAGQGEIFDPFLTNVVASFQRRWRQAAITGSADIETLALIEALAARRG